MSYHATAMIKVPPARISEARGLFLEEGISCETWHATHGILEVGGDNDYSEWSILRVIHCLKGRMNLVVWLLGEYGLTDIRKLVYRNGWLVHETAGLKLLGIYDNAGQVEILE